MLKAYPKINEDGFFVEDVIYDDSTETFPNDVIQTPVPDGLYKPKWDGSAWTEGATEQEIADIQDATVPKSEKQLRIEQLEAQLAAMNTNNIEFMEMVLSTLGVE